MKKILLYLLLILSIIAVGCSFVNEVPIYDNSSYQTNTSLNESLNLCTQEYMPVCGIDGNTYPNPCSAGDMNISHEGVCECYDTVTNSSLSENEARTIAEFDSQCENHLLKNGFCNDVTGTWWFETDIKKEGCHPACVVNVATKEVEINWMCTGLIN